jgi:N-acetylglucosamine-6-phosphate deacetylase
MPRLSGTLVLPGGAAPGAVELEGGRIARVEVASEPGPAAGLPAPYVLPGFVDAHVHGGGGGDAMDGPDGVVTLARFHASRGTTTLLPTTITHPWPEVVRALEGIAAVRPASGGDGLPDVPGAHLEGPFISPDRLGAQPPHAVDPDPELVAEALALDVVRVVTLAPELPGALSAARAFAGAGVRVSVGHTLATAEQAEAVLDAVAETGGVAGFTHLYNAMSQLGSRSPGAVGAALARGDAYAEVILDLHHVHGTAFRAALAAKPGRLLLVTDAMRAAGTDEGESELGGQTVVVSGGAARLRDGTLAGSVLTMDRALRNAVDCGLDLAAATALASTVPADYLGLRDRGRLAAGLRADVVVLGADLAVEEVFVAGRRL